MPSRKYQRGNGLKSERKFQKDLEKIVEQNCLQALVTILVEHLPAFQTVQDLLNSPTKKYSFDTLESHFIEAAKNSDVSEYEKKIAKYVKKLEDQTVNKTANPTANATTKQLNSTTSRTRTNSENLTKERNRNSKSGSKDAEADLHAVALAAEARGIMEDFEFRIKKLEKLLRIISKNTRIRHQTN